ncbi:MAG: hypothetical protein AAFY48_03240 [Bacteroidota bacterium]
MQLQKQITDFIYGTNRVRRKYEAKYPAETVLAADACKGTRVKGEEQIERGAKWVVSKRAVIILTDKNISCGDWLIKLDDIEKATLVLFDSFWGAGQVLQIKTKEQLHFQFGMQRNPAWDSQDALPLTVEKGKLKYSWYSIIVRLLAVAYLLYLFLR